MNVTEERRMERIGEEGRREWDRERGWCVGEGIVVDAGAKGLS